MSTLTEDELLQLAATWGLPLDRGQVRRLLPEVVRLLLAAERLRELPLDPEESPFGS